jgi:hypothetical protein
MNIVDRVKLDKLVVQIKYKLADYVSFSIHKLSANHFVLCDGGYWGTFKLFNGETVGGTFPSLEKAEEALIDIMKYYSAPIKNRDIRRYFNSKWIKTEESADKFILLKQALLNREWKNVAKIYKTMDNHSKEAVPPYIAYQVSINL